MAPPGSGAMMPQQGFDTPMQSMTWAPNSGSSAAFAIAPVGFENSWSGESELGNTIPEIKARRQRQGPLRKDDPHLMSKIQDAVGAPRNYNKIEHLADGKKPNQTWFPDAADCPCCQGQQFGCLSAHSHLTDGKCTDCMSAAEIKHHILNAGGAPKTAPPPKKIQNRDNSSQGCCNRMSPPEGSPGVTPQVTASVPGAAPAGLPAPAPAGSNVDALPFVPAQQQVLGAPAAAPLGAQAQNVPSSYVSPQPNPVNNMHGGFGAPHVPMQQQQLQGPRMPMNNMSNMQQQFMQGQMQPMMQPMQVPFNPQQNMMGGNPNMQMQQPMGGNPNMMRGPNPMQHPGGPGQGPMGGGVPMNVNMQHPMVQYRPYMQQGPNMQQNMPQQQQQQPPQQQQQVRPNMLQQQQAPANVQAQPQQATQQPFQASQHGIPKRTHNQLPQYGTDHVRLQRQLIRRIESPKAGTRHQKWIFRGTVKSYAPPNSSPGKHDGYGFLISDQVTGYKNDIHFKKHCLPPGCHTVSAGQVFDFELVLNSVREQKNKMILNFHQFKKYFFRRFSFC